MAELTPPAPVVSRNLVGILCVVLGMTLIVVQDGFMKTLLGPVSLWPMMSSRGVIGFILFVPLIVLLEGPARVFSPNWRLHALRGALFAAAFSLFYASFPFMQLAEISTIFFAAPLIIAVMAAVFLKEQIGPHRILALAVGFLGVIIALNPTAEAFRPVAIMPLICAVLYAMAQILARKLGDQDSGLTTGLYTVVFIALTIPVLALVASSVLPESPDTFHLRWDWTLPTGLEFLYLIALGTAGMLGITLLSRGYQVASASLLAPFDYTYMPLAAGMAFVLWDEVPGRTTLIGMAMIIAAGVYLAWREARAA